MMFRRLVSTVAVVALGALTAVGATTVAGAAPAQTDAPKVVKIGVLAPLDAGLTEFGKGIRNSVQVAIDQANKRDAIPGWEIELVAVNDSSDPATGAAGAATLVADPAVIGVVGPYNSGVAQAALPVLASGNLALVSPGNTLADLTLGPDAANPVRPNLNYFRLVPSDAQQAPFLAKSVRKTGARRVAVVSETKAVSKGLADAFAAAFTKAGGTIAPQQVVPDGATDFKDFLDAALPDKPDAIFFGGEYQVAAVLRKQATAAGYKGPIVGGDGIKDPAYIAAAGPSSTGDLASTVGAPLESLAGAKAFLKAYKKAGFTDPPSDFGPYAYDAANIMIANAKKILDGQDAIPPSARIGMLTGIQSTFTKGVTGPISFDPFGDTTHRVLTLYRVDGPKKHLVWTPFKP
jgi:branched-chain amino acid transport system substrate-binding protein